MNFLEKVDFVRSRLIGSWCIGAQTQLLIGIPILNLVGLPLAVVAGAVAVRKIEDSTDGLPSSTEPVIDVEVVSPDLPSTDGSTNVDDAVPAALAEVEEALIIDDEHSIDDIQLLPLEENLNAQTDASDSTQGIELNTDSSEHQS